MCVCVCVCVRGGGGPTTFMTVSGEKNRYSRSRFAAQLPTPNHPNLFIHRRPLTSMQERQRIFGVARVQVGSDV